MPQDIRVWEVQDSSGLKEVPKTMLNSEDLLESWLAKDIGILSHGLMVIGRQVETDFGGIVDLLCMDARGDLVIVELKRDRTPREITAQVLDYASWVKDLSNEKITGMADTHLGAEGPLSKAFPEKFGEDLPDTLNTSHRMLVVGSEIDASSERIVTYLSDSYGVAINVATFQFFQNEDGRQLLARVFLVEPEEAERRATTGTTS